LRQPEECFRRERSSDERCDRSDLSHGPDLSAERDGRQRRRGGGKPGVVRPIIRDVTQSSSSRKRSRSVAIAFVSHAYPSYIHQIKSSITTTCTSAARPSPSTRTPVSCVIVKTKTTSKKSSRVETRALRSATARGALHRGTAGCNDKARAKSKAGRLRALKSIR
jgi:hypothetical protein